MQRVTMTTDIRFNEFCFSPVAIFIGMANLRPPPAIPSAQLPEQHKF